MKIRLLERDYVRPGSTVGSEHDVGEALARRLIKRGLAEEAKAKPQKSETPDDTWTRKELEAHAEQLGVDVSAAKNKADVLAAIENPPDENPGGDPDDDDSGSTGDGPDTQ